MTIQNPEKLSIYVNKYNSLGLEKYDIELRKSNNLNKKKKNKILL